MLTLAASTNPADNLSVEVPLVATIEVSTGIAAVTLSWDAAPLGEYQVQYCDGLDQWIDSPTGYLIGGIPGGRLSWIDDGPPNTETDPRIEKRRFYRIVWIR